MNRVDLVGRLTRDPELRHTTSGRPVCQMNLKINRTFTSQSGEREADFINVIVWGKQAESVSKYMTSGRLVSVEGRLQSRSYDDKDGKKVYVTEVIAGNVQFLSSNMNNNQNSRVVEQNPFDFEEPTTSKPVETVSVENDVFENFGDSFSITDDAVDNDLPF